MNRKVLTEFQTQCPIYISEEGNAKHETWKAVFTLQ